LPAVVQGGLNLSEQSFNRHCLTAKFSDKEGFVNIEIRPRFVAAWSQSLMESKYRPLVLRDLYRISDI